MGRSGDEGNSKTDLKSKLWLKESQPCVLAAKIAVIKKNHEASGYHHWLCLQPERTWWRHGACITSFAQNVTLPTSSSLQRLYKAVGKRGRLGSRQWTDNGAISENQSTFKGSGQCSFCRDVDSLICCASVRQKYILKIKLGTRNNLILLLYDQLKTLEGTEILKRKAQLGWLHNDKSTLQTWDFNPRNDWCDKQNSRFGILVWFSPEQCENMWVKLSQAYTLNPRWWEEWWRMNSKNEGDKTKHFQKIKHSKII